MDSRPNRDRISNPGCGNKGIIDHIFDVRYVYKHPFVLFSHVTHRWMGCASCVDEGFATVMRDGQLNAIVYPSKL